MTSISLNQSTQTALQQQQQLLINLAMKQAFHVMQLPIQELSEWLCSEIENNPVLDIDLSKQSSHTAPCNFRSKSQSEEERRRRDHQENQLPTEVSLYEHMMSQAPLILEEREDLNLAQLIIGHLNEKGFLDTPLADILPSVPLEKMQTVLETIQSFDPPGIGARDLQECLLIQLKLKQKQGSSAYQIIAHHFQDLLHNQLPRIAQALKIPIDQLVKIIEKEIAPLDLYPGYKYSPQKVVALIPDLFFLCVEGKWQIEVNTSLLPKFQIAPIYLQALKESSLDNEESCYLRRQISGGRWLFRIVQRRNATLRGIGAFLLKKQRAFFEGDKAGLVPLTMKEAAEELGLHESTIARAVAGKFVACPSGMFLLKSFFKQGVTTESGAKISNHSLRAILAKAIQEEDKLHPLSDEQLASHFSKRGIPCARRTIAKYRTSLKIAPARKRRRWQ